MKNILAFLIFCLIGFGLTQAYRESKKQKFIDYPEEIRNAKQGDSLIISRVTKDTIYLEFNNLRNR